jgi:predicted P-loop ATPase
MNHADYSTSELFSAANFRRMNEREASAASASARPPEPPSSEPPSGPHLTDQHRAHLRASGLSDETIAVCRYESIRGDAESETSLPKRLGWRGKPPKDAPLGGGILIPYFDANGSPTDCVAFRPDTPRLMKTGRKAKTGREAKYLRTTYGRGAGSPPYFPPNGRAALEDQSKVLVIVEGEKKAAALAQLGYAVIGIAGVYNAHEANDERWVLRGDIAVHVTFRDVVVAFDSDAHTNHDVLQAAKLLAGMLRDKGASSVRFATPPAGGPKGFDDLLAASGEAAVRAAIAGAKPIEPASTTKKQRAWDELVVRSDKGAIRPSAGNASLILAGHEKLADLLSFNERKGIIEYRRPPPWGGAPGPHSEHDLVKLAAYLGALPDIGVAFTTAALGEAVAEVARRKPFDPLHDYLNGLAWDGTPRLDRWLHDYAGASDGDDPTRRAYVEAVGARWMISAVARVFRPGCKVDHLLVLEGPQGIGKSSLLAALAHQPEWFLDHLPDLHEKDARLALHGPWIIEWSELAALGRARIETVKSFITSTTDTFRPPYGRAPVAHPRRCVFAGTVNDDGSGWLADPTGSRRFWPVAVTRCDVEGLRAARDQLWAEAVERYRRGDPWWMVRGDAISKALGSEHESRFAIDPWEARLERQLADTVEITSTAVLEVLMGDLAHRATRSDQMRAAKALKRLGFHQVRRGWSRTRVYRRNDPVGGNAADRGEP